MQAVNVLAVMSTAVKKQIHRIARRQRECIATRKDQRAKVMGGVGRVVVVVVLLFGCF